MKKTSITHPLKIAAIHAAEGAGQVGITFCPGKRDCEWDRDLELDLDAIQRWGASAVVTLLEPHELTLLKVADLGEGVSRRGMRWFHLPMVDLSSPDKTFEATWALAGEELRSMLLNSDNVLVHCRGGLGRAGTIAARLLVELGMKPTKAIAEVRKVRSGAIQTTEQERFILDLRPIPERTLWAQSISGRSR